MVSKISTANTYLLQFKIQTSVAIKQNKNKNKTKKKRKKKKKNEALNARTSS